MYQELCITYLDLVAIDIGVLIAAIASPFVMGWFKRVILKVQDD